MEIEMFRFYDSEGRHIGVDDIKCMTENDCKIHEVHLKEQLNGLTWAEINFIMILIEESLKMGQNMDIVRREIELYDKLKKMREQNCSK